MYDQLMAQPLPIPPKPASAQAAAAAAPGSGAQDKPPAWFYIKARNTPSLTSRLEMFLPRQQRLPALPPPAAEPPTNLDIASQLSHLRDICRWDFRIDATRLGVTATTLARTVIRMIGFEDALAALPPAIQVVIQAFQQNMQAQHEDLQAQHEETRRLINTRLDDLDGRLATLNAEIASLKDAANSHLQETIEINTQTQRRLRGRGGPRRGRGA
ncbi:hypothetical protein PtA15_11A120 [Puccinia triticina]|nr:uncharacterized protein PtA15_11A120 [Puccinia triticina]WAQ89432.1 hypothetical protein PtA15_11A120 [Puccinia triticina]WAR59489.1 hypothetical protein PtB15_11B129 [Puccinia triticina]